MSSYILSNANRYYAAIEPAYGVAGAVTAANRFPAVALNVEQVLEQARRRDKTGTRTFLGNPPNARKSTAFEVQTYLTSWKGTGTPSYGPLFQAALGGTPTASPALTVRQVSNQSTFQTTVAHGLKTGTAIAVNNEIRFVTGTPDGFTVTVNAPFSSGLLTGTAIKPALTYGLATQLPSVTLYDYWDPATAVQRVITGCGVDTLDVSVNGDLHEFTFRGPGCDVVDSATFLPGVSGLTQFPQEPGPGSFDYSIVPGHLGQAWIGSSASQVWTLTSAHVQLKNHLDTRHREFGATVPRALSPGKRQVAVNFSLLAQDDAQSAALYQAARTRTPVGAMLQLGQTAGELMGIYLPNVVPEMPHFNSGEPRLEWDFKSCLAQGRGDDELVIAFA